MNDFKLVLLGGLIFGGLTIAFLNIPIEDESFNQEELEVQRELNMKHCVEARRGIYSIDFDDDMVEICDDILRGERVM